MRWGWCLRTTSARTVALVAERAVDVALLLRLHHVQNVASLRVSSPHTRSIVRIISTHCARLRALFAALLPPPDALLDVERARVREVRLRRQPLISSDSGAAAAARAAPELSLDGLRRLVLVHLLAQRYPAAAILADDTAAGQPRDIG